MKPFKEFKKDKFKRDNDKGKTFKRFDSSSSPAKFAKKKFDRSGGSGERSFSSGRSFNSDRGSDKKGGFELHQAVCDKCGRECDIPFKPTGGKPIYCRSCFRENKGEGSSNERFDRGSERRSFDRRESRNDSNMPSSSSVSAADIEAINEKLDKIMRFLKINK